jgi:excisionase family DNA binding protein
MTDTIDFNREIFSVAEAAAYLKISRALIYKLIAAKRLKPFKVGTRTLFLGAELARFVESAQHAA